jgi:hypothetical protein
MRPVTFQGYYSVRLENLDGPPNLADREQYKTQYLIEDGVRRKSDSILKQSVVDFHNLYDVHPDDLQGMPRREIGIDQYLGSRFVVAVDDKKGAHRTELTQALNKIRDDYLQQHNIPLKKYEEAFYPLLNMAGYDPDAPETKAVLAAKKYIPQAQQDYVDKLYQAVRDAGEVEEVIWQYRNKPKPNEDFWPQLFIEQVVPTK